MTEARAQAVEVRLAQMPQSCQGLYKRAVTGKSLRACIKAQCLECVAWQRVEVTLCTSLACPLYPVRPFQPKVG